MDPENNITRFDPRAKIAAAIFFVAAIIIAGLDSILFLLLPMQILFLIFNRGKVIFILKAVLRIAPMVLLITTVQIFSGTAGEEPVYNSPFEIYESGLSMFYITNLKFLLVAITSFSFLSLTPINQVIAALEKLHLPPAFISVVFFTERFFHILLKEVHKKYIAYKSRYVKLNFLSRISYLGKFTASISIDAMGKSERIYYSLSSRSYNGVLPTGIALSWNTRDSILVAAFIIIPVIMVGLK